jgi:hypothetical protein
MERTAEIAVNIKPDWQHGQVSCAEHYSGMSPITPEAKRLQEQGYYLLSCLPRDHQMYKLMEPYGNCVQFIHFFLFFGLIIYFLTSSDSGSMTDDIITASGLAPTQIPVWQKVFWCFTEGIVALGLVGAGPALKSLQHVSIIIGLPYTFFLCMLVPSLYRSLKKEAGDSDIVESKKFNTQLLDIFELFVPKSGSPFPPGKHLQCIVMSTFAPFVPLTAIFKKAYPESPMTGLGFGIVGQGLLVCVAHSAVRPDWRQGRVRDQLGLLHLLHLDRHLRARRDAPHLQDLGVMDGRPLRRPLPLPVGPCPVHDGGRERQRGRADLLPVDG